MQGAGPKTAKQLSIGEGQSASAAGRKRKLTAISADAAADAAAADAAAADTATTDTAAASAAAAADTASARAVTPAVSAVRAAASTPRPPPAVTAATSASNVLGSAYGLHERLCAQAAEDDRLLRAAQTESERQHKEVMSALSTLGTSIANGLRDGLREIANGLRASPHQQTQFGQPHYAPPPAYTAFGTPSAVFRIDNGSS